MCFNIECVCVCVVYVFSLLFTPSLLSLDTGRFVGIASDPLSLIGMDISAPQQLRRGMAELTLADLQKTFGSTCSVREWRCITTSPPSSTATATATAAATAAAAVSSSSPPSSSPPPSHSMSDAAGPFSDFRLHWSLKEAFVKARGDGLAFDLAAAEFSHGPLSEFADHAPAASDAGGASGSADAAGGGGGGAAASSSSSSSTSSLQHRVEAKLAAARLADSHAITLTSQGRDLSRTWKFSTQLIDKHWFSVALGPCSEAVDAFGEFKATLKKLPGGPNIVDVDKTDKTKGCDGDFDDEDMMRFVQLSVRDLVPKERIAEYDDSILL